MEWNLRRLKKRKTSSDCLGESSAVNMVDISARLEVLHPHGS